MRIVKKARTARKSFSGKTSDVELIDGLAETELLEKDEMYHQSYHQQAFRQYHPVRYSDRRGYHHQQNEESQYARNQDDQLRQHSMQDRDYTSSETRRGSYYKNKENRKDPGNLDYYMLSKGETEHGRSSNPDGQRRSYSPRMSCYDSRREERYRRNSSPRKYTNSPREYTTSRSSRHCQSRSPRCSSRSPSRRRDRSRKREEKGRSKSSSSSRSASVTSVTSGSSIGGNISPKKSRGRDSISEKTRASEYRSKKPMSIIKKVYKKTFLNTYSRSHFDRSRYTWKKQETKVEMTIGDLTMSPISSDDFSQRSEEADSEVDKEETDNKTHLNVELECENVMCKDSESKQSKEEKPVKVTRTEKTDKTKHEVKKVQEEKTASNDEISTACSAIKDANESDRSKHENKRSLKRKNSREEADLVKKDRKPTEKGNCLDDSKEHVDLKNCNENLEESGCINDAKDCVGEKGGCSNTTDLSKEKQPEKFLCNTKVTVPNSKVSDNNKEDTKNKKETQKAEKFDQKNKGSVEELKETLLQTKSIDNEMINKIVSLMASNSKITTEVEVNKNNTSDKGRKEIHVSGKAENKDEKLINSKNDKLDQSSKSGISRRKSKSNEKVAILKGIKDKTSDERKQNEESVDANKPELTKEKVNAKKNEERLKSTEKQKEHSNSKNTYEDPSVKYDLHVDKNLKEKEQNQYKKSLIKESSEMFVESSNKEVSKQELVKELNTPTHRLNGKRRHSLTKSSMDENIIEHKHHEGQFERQSAVEKTNHQPVSPEVIEYPPYASQSSVQNKGNYFSGARSVTEQRNKVPKFDLVNTRYGNNKNYKKFGDSGTSQGKSSDGKGKESSQPAPSDLDQSRSHTLTLNEKKKCFEARIKSKEKHEIQDMQCDTGERFIKNPCKNIDPFRDKDSRKLLDSFDKSSFPTRNSSSTNGRERKLSGVVETNKINIRKRHGSESSSPAIIKGTMNRPTGDVFIPLGKPSEKKRRFSATSPTLEGSAVHDHVGSKIGDALKLKEKASFADMETRYEKSCSKKESKEKELSGENTVSGPKKSLFGKNRKRVSHCSSTDENAIQDNNVVKTITMKPSTTKSPPSKHEKNPLKQFSENKLSKPSPVKEHKKEISLRKETATFKNKNAVLNSSNTVTKFPEAHVRLTPVDNIFEKMKEDNALKRIEEKGICDEKSKSVMKRTHDEQLKNTNEKRRKHEENIAENVIKKDKNTGSEQTEHPKNEKEKNFNRKSMSEKKSKHHRSKSLGSTEKSKVEDDDKVKFKKSNKHTSKHEQEVFSPSTSESVKLKSKVVKCLEICQKSGTIDSINGNKKLNDSSKKDNFELTWSKSKKCNDKSETKSISLQNENQMRKRVSADIIMSQDDNETIHIEVQKLLSDTTEKISACERRKKQVDKVKKVDSQNLKEYSLSVFDSDKPKCMDVKCVENEMHADKVGAGKKVSKSEKGTSQNEVKKALHDNTKSNLASEESDKQNKKVQVAQGDGKKKTDLKTTKFVGIKSPLSVKVKKKLDVTENKKQDLKKKVEKNTSRDEKTKTVTKQTKWVGVPCAEDEKKTVDADSYKQCNAEIENQNALKDRNICVTLTEKNGKDYNNTENENYQHIGSGTVDGTMKDICEINKNSDKLTHDDSDSDMDDIEPLQMMGSVFMNDVDKAEPAENILNNQDDVDSREMFRYCDDNICFQKNNSENVFENINGDDKLVEYPVKVEDFFKGKNTEKEQIRYGGSEGMVSDVVSENSIEKKNEVHREDDKGCDEVTENTLERNKLTENALKSDRPRIKTPRKRFAPHLVTLGKLLGDEKSSEKEECEESRGAKTKIPKTQPKKRSNTEAECSYNDDAELTSSSLELTPIKTLDKSAKKTNEWLQRAKSNLKVPASFKKAETKICQSSAQSIQSSNQCQISCEQQNSVQQVKVQMGSTSYSQHQQKNQNVHEASASFIQPVNQNQECTSPDTQSDSVKPSLPQVIKTPNCQREQSVNIGMHQTQQFQTKATERPEKQAFQQEQAGLAYALQVQSSQKSQNYQQSVKSNSLENQPKYSFEQSNYLADIHQIPHMNATNKGKTAAPSQNVANIPMFNPLTAPLMNQNMPSVISKSQPDTRYESKPPVNRSDYTGIPFTATQSQGIPVVIPDYGQYSDQSASTSYAMTQNVNYNKALEQIEMPGVQEPVRSIWSTQSKEQALTQETSPPSGVISRRISRQVMIEASVEEERQKLYRALCTLDNINTGDAGLDIMLLAEKSYLRGMMLINKDILRLAEKRYKATRQQGQQQQVLKDLTGQGVKSIEERAKCLGQLKQHRQ